MKKRGQFYLIAALIIVGIAAGLATIHNSSKTSEEDVAVYDLSQEIDFESAQVIDNGVFKASLSPNTNTNIISLTQHYCAKSTEDTSFVVVYGTTASASIITCEDISTGKLGISTGGSITLNPQSNVRSKQRVAGTGPVAGTGTQAQTITVQGGGFDQDFMLTDTDKFFVVIQRDKHTDRFVSVEDD